jgi:hypothetical protein
MLETLLKKIQIVTENEFLVKFYEADEVMSTPAFLILSLGKDYKKRERYLKIIPKSEDLSLVLGEQLKTEEALVSFEFCFDLPILFLPETCKEVGSFLHFINKDLYLPGFILDETQDKILFRHVLVCTASSINRHLIMGILGLILLYADLYTPSTELVSSGKKSFQDMMNELLKVSGFNLD